MKKIVYEVFPVGLKVLYLSKILVLKSLGPGWRRLGNLPWLAELPGALGCGLNFSEEFRK